MNGHENLKPDQGELFGVSSHDGLKYLTEPSPHAQPVDAGPAGPQTLIAETIDARVRAAYLLSTLDLLALANRGRGFLAATSEGSPELPRIKSGVGDDEAVSHFAREVNYKKNSQLIKARKEFLRAYETGMGRVGDEDPGFTEAWADFYRSYNGTSNRKARDKHRKNLTKIKNIKGQPLHSDSYIDEPELAKPELKTLTKKEKLDIFEDDSRLLFAPATNREEEQARRALNYMDKPHGMLDMLNEIDRSNYKVARKKGESHSKAKQIGDLGRQSVIFEWGSYVGNAKESLDSLKDLQARIQAIDDMDTPLIDIAGLDHEALAVLVRDVDYDTFRKHGITKRRDDPLQTREDRRPQVNPSRNKQVEDRYTGSQVDEETRNQIQLWAQVTTARDLLGQGRLKRTVDRQQHRVQFWDRLLQSTEGSDKRIAQDIRQELGLVA